MLTNSRDVAEFFEKDHKTVLKAIRNLLGQEAELDGLNFLPVSYMGENGQERPCYDMDRDGFSLLASRPLNFLAALFQCMPAPRLHRAVGALTGAVESSRN